MHGTVVSIKKYWNFTYKCAIQVLTWYLYQYFSHHWSKRQDKHTCREKLWGGQTLVEFFPLKKREMLGKGSKKNPANYPLFVDKKRSRARVTIEGQRVLLQISLQIKMFFCFCSIAKITVWIISFQAYFCIPKKHSKNMRN